MLPSPLSAGQSQHFNPRSSCEERLIGRTDAHASLVISIHAPHARSDKPCNMMLTLLYQIFQSTLLMRGATEVTGAYGMLSTFQSTLLMRGATFSGWCYDFAVKISIHAPHARSDRRSVGPVHPDHHISIHAPHARSDYVKGDKVIRATISIHAPHARSDSHADRQGHKYK